MCRNHKELINNSSSEFVCLMQLTSDESINKVEKLDDYNIGYNVVKYLQGQFIKNINYIMNEVLSIINLIMDIGF